MKRAVWGSKLGFVFAAAGSAVGLANIWRFPYLVGTEGGAAFVAVYLISLFLVGFPVFIAEVLIGRTAKLGPPGAFFQLTQSRLWGFMGKVTVLTGFLVSAFYSAIAAWILGYLVEAIKGNLSNVAVASEAALRHEALLSNPYWGVGFHALFLLVCFGVLTSGVKRGIERWNKVIMPLLYLVLLALIFRGITLPGGTEGLQFLFKIKWSEITPLMFLIALGQSFFTLSLGQGTMVTYGSYLEKEENLLSACIPVTFMDTFVSLFSAVAIFSIAFAAGIQPDEGPSLLFKTLPLAFSQVPGGYFVSVAFFLLVFFAALTSQISAMEPSIAYLIDRFHFRRKTASSLVFVAVLLAGIPAALSSSLLREARLFEMTPFELMAFLCSDILIPLGGLAAVLLVGWKWKIQLGLVELKRGVPKKWAESSLFDSYFSFSIKILSPLLILIVFLSALGVFA